MPRFWQGSITPTDGEELADMVRHCMKPSTREWDIELEPGKDYVLPTDGPLRGPLIMSTPGNGIGAVRIYTRNETSHSQVGSQARIISESLDWPAIIFQHDRGSKLQDIEIVGPNDFSQDFPSFFELLDDSMFRKADVRDNRYSPQCAIAIDAITDGAPGGDDANMYPGLEDLYSELPLRGASSSATKFERVTLRGHNVGFGISLGGATGNAENMDFAQCTTNMCRVHYANGNSQARCNYLRGISAYGGMIFQSTGLYGQRIGSPLHIFGANVGGMQGLFHLVSGHDDFYAASLYAESFHTLGWLGMSATSAPGSAVFDGCRFTFMTPNAAGQYSEVFPDAQMANFMAVIFNGGNLRPRTPYALRNLLRVFNQAPVTFNSFGLAAYDGVSATGDGNLPLSFHRPDFVRMNDCRIHPESNPTWVDSRNVSYDSTAVGTVSVTHTEGGTGSFTLSDHGCSVADVIYPASTIADWKPKSHPANDSYATGMAIGIVSAVDGDTVTLVNMPETLTALLPLSLTLQRRTISFG